MSFALSIPTPPKSAPLVLSVAVGEMLFILGANGTGKSSLMQAFASARRDKTRRITAHRQTWFRSGSPEFTCKQRADWEENVTNYDQQADARWMDQFAQQRAQMAIYDLVNSENVRAREITRAVDQNHPAEVASLARISHRAGGFASGLGFLGA